MKREEKRVVLSNRLLYTLIALGIIFIIAGTVYAVDTTQAWHSASQIDFSSGLSAPVSISYTAGQQGFASIGPSGNSHIPYTNGEVYLSGGKIHFRNTANQDKMTLDTSNGNLAVTGSVGIGSNTYLADYSSSMLGIYWNADPTRASIKLGSSGGVVSGYNGMVGINTPNPQRALEVNGQLRVDSFSEFKDFITVDGEIYMSRDSTPCTCTDAGITDRCKGAIYFDGSLHYGCRNWNGHWSWVAMD